MERLVNLGTDSNYSNLGNSSFGHSSRCNIGGIEIWQGAMGGRPQDVEPAESLEEQVANSQYADFIQVNQNQGRRLVINAFQIQLIGNPRHAPALHADPQEPQDIPPQDLVPQDLPPPNPDPRNAFQHDAARQFALPPERGELDDERRAAGAQRINGDDSPEMPSIPVS